MVNRYYELKSKHILILEKIKQEIELYYLNNFKIKHNIFIYIIKPYLFYINASLVNTIENNYYANNA